MSNKLIFQCIEIALLRMWTATDDSHYCELVQSRVEPALRQSFFPIAVYCYVCEPKIKKF